jgi:hypothetical protein
VALWESTGHREFCRSSCSCWRPSAWETWRRCTAPRPRGSPGGPLLWSLISNRNLIRSAWQGGGVASGGDGRGGYRISGTHGPRLRPSNKPDLTFRTSTTLAICGGPGQQTAASLCWPVPSAPGGLPAPERGTGRLGRPTSAPGPPGPPVRLTWHPTATGRRRPAVLALPGRTPGGLGGDVGRGPLGLRASREDGGKNVTVNCAVV